MRFVEFEGMGGAMILLNLECIESVVQDDEQRTQIYMRGCDDAYCVKGSYQAISRYIMSLAEGLRCNHGQCSFECG